MFYCYGVLLETKELLRRASLFLSLRMSEDSKFLSETIRERKMEGFLIRNNWVLTEKRSEGIVEASKSLMF